MSGDVTEPPAAEPQDRASIRRNLGSMMTSQLVTWTLATATAFIVPRFLGPATLGELRLATSLWLLAATIAAVGTAQFLQIEIAQDAGRGLRLVGPTLVLRTIAFVVSAMAVVAYVAVTSHPDGFLLIVAIAGLAALVMLWSDVLATAFLGLERMTIPAIANGINKVIYFVGVLALLVAGAGVIGVLAVTLGAAVVVLAYLAVHLRRRSTISFSGWPRESWRIFRMSRTFMAATVALVAYQQIDIVVISWVADEEDLGWYGAADTLFGSLLFPATVLIGTIFPTMGRLHKSDPEALRHLVQRAFSTLVLVAVPVGLGTTVIAPRFAPFLYGDDYAETGRVLEILGPVTILTFGTILFGAVALTTGRGSLWVGVMFAAAAITVPLDLVLVPWADDRLDNGAVGGALAYLVTEALQFTIGLLVVARFLVNRTLIWRIARVGLAGGAMLAVGLALRSAPQMVTIAACAVVYAVGIVAMRVLTPDERQMAHSLLNKLGLAR